MFWLVATWTAYPQALSNELGDFPLQRHIKLADGEIHRLEIGSVGVYLDGKLKASVKGRDGRFLSVHLLSETQDYWDENEDFYKNGSKGFWLLFGTSLATGMCGMPTYAVTHVDSKGNVRLSAESPSVCIGDWPSSIDFRFLTDSRCENGYPVWKLSNALQFNGCSFTWKEIRKAKTKLPKTKR